MSVDVYKKAAVEALARLKGKTPVVIALLSSGSKVDAGSSGEALAKAFVSLKEDAVLGDVSKKSCDSAAGAEAAVKELTEKHQLTLLPLPCPREEETAMLLAAAAGRAILVEKRNLSRTDEIEQTLEILRNLDVEPMGFLLE